MKRLLILLILILLIQPAFAMVFEEQFYGTVKYIDGSPVPKGSVISVTDQHGTNIGKFTMRADGVYGGQQRLDPKLVVTVVNASGDTQMIFSVNGNKEWKRVIFSSSDTVEHNIVVAGPPVTRAPTAVATTLAPTPIPTMAQTATSISTTVPVAIATPAMIGGIPAEIVYVGIVVGMIIIVMIITFIVFSYLERKTQNEEVLLPDGRRIKYK